MFYVPGIGTICNVECEHCGDITMATEGRADSLEGMPPQFCNALCESLEREARRLRRPGDPKASQETLGKRKISRYPRKT